MSAGCLHSHSAQLRVKFWLRPGSEESDEMGLKSQNVPCGCRNADVVFRSVVRIKFVPQRTRLLSDFKSLVLLCSMFWSHS